MTRNRSFAALAGGLLIAAFAVLPTTPVRAQSGDVLIDILGEILNNGLESAARESEIEDRARYELDEELYRIEEERDRLQVEFDRKRWEVNRRYDALYERRIADRRYGNRRYYDDDDRYDDDDYYDRIRYERKPRKIRRQIEARRADELQRLDEELSWRLAELDRQQRAAERRYERRIRYGRDDGYDYRNRDYRLADYPDGARFKAEEAITGQHFEPAKELPLDREALGLTR